MRYYHGTSDALNIGHTVLPPVNTGVQTEDRLQRRNKVFLTTDLQTAKMYARRASKKWGGNPIVLEVETEDTKRISKRGPPFGPIYVADNAKVIDSTAHRKNPPELYHGTSLANLMNILKEGIMIAGRGISAQRTKTRQALFWTTDPENALLYANSGGHVPIIFQLNVFPRDLKPDYDDAGVILSVDLMELQQAFNEAGYDEDVQLGMSLTEEQETLVERFAEHCGYGERTLPCTLRSENGRLYSEPWILNGVDMSVYEECPEDYLDDTEIIWDEGNAAIMSQQFMTFQEIPLDWVTIWAPREAFRVLEKKIPKRPVDRLRVMDYSDAQCSRLNLFRKIVFYRLR